MSRFDMWLDQQKTLVDSGAAVEKVLLEGPDGSAWGTWTLRFPNLSESIEGMLGTLREQMPKGKHPAKLLALAGDGSQVSCFPLTIVGASDHANEAAQSQMNLQKAVALAISNMEKLTLGLNAALEAANTRESQITERYTLLLESLNRVEDASRESFREDERRAASAARLDKTLESLNPLIAVGADFLGRYAVKWLEKSSAEPEKKAESLPSSSVVDSSNAAPETSGESVESLPSSASVPTRVDRSDGKTGSDRDGRSISRDCGAKAQKRSAERKRRA